MMFMRKRINFVHAFSRQVHTSFPTSELMPSASMKDHAYDMPNPLFAGSWVYVQPKVADF